MHPLLHKMVVCACALAFVQAGHAADEQQVPLKVIHGFSAGGAPDVALRKIADRLAHQLGRAVVVENRPGASGTIAAATVARAPADGNTLLFGVAASLAVAPATMRTPPYDPVLEFTPIVEVARGPYVLLVRADAPAPNYRGFVAWARSHPGRLNYGSPGLGSVHHLATEMLKGEEGLAIVHIPYRTGLYPALLAGDVQVMLDSLPSPLSFLESGKLRALAVTGPRRLERLPEVPTLRELGVRSLVDVSSWWGFVGPAGLSPAIVQKLNSEIRTAMADPELRATFRGWGIEPTPGTAAEFGRLIADENRRWREQVRRLGLALE
jgi:tripartite-type tricarboxylate transporter receptor subunit TctC